MSGPTTREAARGSPAGGASRASRRARVLACVSVLVGVLALDLATKAWAWERLQDRPGIVVQPGVLVLEFAFNTGSAFGMLADAEWARTFFILVTLAALVYLARLALTLPTRFASGFVALGLISGGALGNLHDRLFRVRAVRTYFSEIGFSDLLGHAEEIASALPQSPHYAEIGRHGVVDFIVFYYWPHRRWPAFNVADIALTVGVGLFMLYLHRHGSTEPRAEAGPKNGPEA
jgi:signal peptidase II